MRGVGRGDFTDGTSRKAKRPHLQRLLPEYICEGMRRHKLEVLQRNRIRLRRSHGGGVSHMPSPTDRRSDREGMVTT